MVVYSTVLYSIVCGYHAHIPMLACSETLTMMSALNMLHTPIRMHTVRYSFSKTRTLQ